MLQGTCCFGKSGCQKVILKLIAVSVLRRGRGTAYPDVQPKTMGEFQKLLHELLRIGPMIRAGGVYGPSFDALEQELIEMNW